MNIGYTQFRREKVSLCNLCRQKKSLSWDHVPPKGGIEITSVEQEAILERLTGDPAKPKYSISQNGVKYRTLCAKCNNEWLGAKYDPILNDFAIGIGRFLNTTIDLPPVIDYETKPTALIRAILGHLLAAKAHIDDSIFDQRVRDFFFDESVGIPDDTRIFYWIYPYEDIVIIRDIVMPAVRGRGGKLGFFNILKYFPIGYVVCDLDSYEGLNELTRFRRLRPDQSASVPINLRGIRHPQWPEIVDGGNFIAGGLSLESSLHAKPRGRKS